MQLTDFEALAKSRRSIRNFKPDPIPDDLLNRILDIAHWAPSGYNLQPTHFIVVTDQQVKDKLVSACMGQRQIAQAPAVVVFTGDRMVMENNFHIILEMDKNCGALDDKYEKIMKKYVGLAFSHKPLGLGWVWKACLLPVVNLFKPLPDVPAVKKRCWLVKQVSLTAMNFMLAAEAAGLSTVPMEGFAEKAVKRILQIPASHVVPLIIPIGYSEPVSLCKSRLPLPSIVHSNKF
jgi:nitroreductase